MRAFFSLFVDLNSFLYQTLYDWHEHVIKMIFQNVYGVYCSPLFYGNIYDNLFPTNINGFSLNRSFMFFFFSFSYSNLLDEKCYWIDLILFYVTLSNSILIEKKKRMKKKKTVHWFMYFYNNNKRHQAFEKRQKNEIVSMRKTEKQNFLPIFWRYSVCGRGNINITSSVTAMFVAQRWWCSGWYSSRWSICWAKIFWPRIQVSSVFITMNMWRRCISFIRCCILGQCTFRWCSLTFFTIRPITSVWMRIINGISATSRNIRNIMAVF